MSKITLTQARQLAAADRDVRRAEARLEAAKLKRYKLRSRLLPLVPLSTSETDAERGVRELRFANGGKVRITPIAGHSTFALSDYLKAGGRITTTMAPHVGETGGYDRWSLTAIEPPAETGRVSPRRGATRRRSTAATT